MIEYSNVLKFLIEYDWLIQFLIWIIIIILQWKFSILDRIKKRIAKWKNKRTELNFAIEYNTEITDFTEIKTKIKKILSSKTQIKVKRDLPVRLDLQYDKFSINIILNSNNNIFFELDKIDCGISDMKDKIIEFLEIIDEFKDKKIINNFIVCDSKFFLPYNWEYLKIKVPERLNLERYEVILNPVRKERKETKIISEVSIKLSNKESKNIQNLNIIATKENELLKVIELFL